MKVQQINIHNNNNYFRDATFFIHYLTRLSATILHSTNAHAILLSYFETFFFNGTQLFYFILFFLYENGIASQSLKAQC